MKPADRIPLRQVCDVYRVDFSLVLEWADFGLYPLVGAPEPSIEVQTVERLRKIISLHRALGINKEGIEAVLILTRRIEELELELASARRMLERQSRGWGTDTRSPSAQDESPSDW